MSKEIVIVTEKRNRMGATLIFPEVGQKEVSAEGKVSLPEHIATSVVENGVGWSFEKEAPVAKEEVAEVTSEGEEMDLASMTVKELKAICQAADIDESEYKGLKKADLIKFIEEKI